MLTEKQMEKLRDSIVCKNPVYLFDDDPDGLSAFLLLYEVIREGRGICVKSSPEMKAVFAHKVLETEPDAVFILDKPLIEPDFFGHFKCPIIWIDHHEHQEHPSRVIYINPRSNNKENYMSTTQIIFRTFRDDLKRPWLAAVGAFGDWCMPDFVDELREKYPGLIGDGDTLEKMTKDSKITELVRIFSFVLKGTTTEVNARIRALSRIQHYDEIFTQSTPEGKKVWKAYKSVEKEFERVKKHAERINKGKVMAVISENEGMSFSRDMAAELIREHPDNIIIVARRKSGEVKGSIRSTKLDLKKIMPKAVEGLQGYAGGHEHAHGFLVKQEDFPTLLERLAEVK